MVNYKIKCFGTDSRKNSVSYVVKGEKGWKICGKTVEKPHIFTDFAEADKVKTKLGSAFKGKVYFLIEVSINEQLLHNGLEDAI